MANKDLVTNELGISQKQWELIGATTPSDKIKKRPGRGGKTFDYVETGYIVDLLNTTFNGLWDFEVEEQTVGKTQVWVKGKLTVWISPEMKITKTQFGGSDVKKDREGNFVDIADDLKAASSDALKKCASLLGFARDIYWKEKPSDTSVTENRSANEIVGVGHPTEKQINYINALCSDKGIDREEIKKEYKVESMKDLSYSQGQEIIKKLLELPDTENSGKENIDPNDF